MHLARRIGQVNVSKCNPRFIASLPVPFRTQLFINSEWRDAEGGRTFTVSNPATEEELFECARASAKDVDIAVRAAKDSFFGSSWGKRSEGKFRGDILRKMGALLQEKKEEFAILETLDNGKPLGESRADMDACIGLFEYYAGLADEWDANRVTPVKTQDTDFEVRLVREPIGVIGMVTPWNFPLMQAVAKIAPALATGCSMVLKPSSVCPATCLRLGDLAVEAGLPTGALNIITGSGSEAGQQLLDHKAVNALSFTGSSGIGETVMHSAAKSLVPTCVELGGKGAVVVFDDISNLDAVIDWIMVGIFVCSGQVCSATSRLIVARSLEDRLIERLVEATRKLRIGNPLDESTQFGAITNKEQLDTTIGFVERAIKDGAELVYGGKPISGKGYWYEPTILKAKPGTEVWQEEIFGPVLVYQAFDDEEDAVRLANDTAYGLGNAVITDNDEQCERVAQQLHAGVVWKNCSNAIPVEAPFGGFGKSGFGKEYGALGLEEYVQTKVITGSKPGFSWKWYS
jgi:betaine-aldehyde dehydrogenase